MNCMDEIKRELKCMDEIKRKWWAIIQKYKCCNLSGTDENRDGQGSKTLFGPCWTLPFFKGKGLFFLDPKGPGPGLKNIIRVRVRVDLFGPLDLFWTLFNFFSFFFILESI